MANWRCARFRVESAENLYPRGADREHKRIGFVDVTLVTPELMGRLLRGLFEEGQQRPAGERLILCITTRPPNAQCLCHEGVRTSSWSSFTSTDKARPSGATLGTVMFDTTPDGKPLERYFRHDLADVTELMVTYDAENPSEAVRDALRPPALPRAGKRSE